MLGDNELNAHYPVCLCFALFCLLFRAAPEAYEVSRLRVESELQLPADATATAMWDMSCVCNLHHSSWPCWILNPLSEARDRTCIFMDTSQVLNRLSHNGNSRKEIASAAHLQGHQQSPGQGWCPPFNHTPHNRRQISRHPAPT